MLKRQIALCTLMTLAFIAVSGLVQTSTIIGVENVYAQGGPPSSPGSGLMNPLRSEYDTIPKLLLAIVEIILIFAVPVIIFFIIYGGFLFVTARGDTSQLEKARTTLTWAVVGGVVVLGAKALVDVIQATVDSFR